MDKRSEKRKEARLTRNVGRVAEKARSYPCGCVSFVWTGKDQRRGNKYARGFRKSRTSAGQGAWLMWQWCPTHGGASQ